VVYIDSAMSSAYLLLKRITGRQTDRQTESDLTSGAFT